MKISKILKTGIIGGLISLSTASCKKTSPRFYPIKDAPKGMVNQINLIKWETGKVLRNSQYKCFGKDTLEITKDVFNGTHAYMKKMNDKAIKQTPLKILEPIYINQKTVVTSSDIFTKNGEDIYVPVEYYGIPNPKLK